MNQHRTSIENKTERPQITPDSRYSTSSSPSARSLGSSVPAPGAKRLSSSESKNDEDKKGKKRVSIVSHRNNKEVIMVHIVGEPDARYPYYVPAATAETKMPCCSCCCIMCKKESIRTKFKDKGKCDIIVAFGTQALWILIFVFIYIAEKAINEVAKVAEEFSGGGSSDSTATTTSSEPLINLFVDDGTDASREKKFIFFSVYGTMTLFSFMLGPLCCLAACYESRCCIILHIICGTIVMVSQSVLFLLLQIFNNSRVYTLQMLFVNFHYLRSAWTSFAFYDKLYDKGVSWDDKYQRERPKILPPWMAHPTIESMKVVEHRRSKYQTV